MSHIKTITALVFTLILSSEVFSQRQNKADMKRYTKVPAGYLMVLRQGDDILKELETFAENEKIPAANFTGMGFVNMKFGFFNFKTKEYDPKEFEGVELASMQGTIAWQKEKVSIHAHGVVTDKNFNAFGGHILSGTVGTGSVEIMLTIHDKKLERKFEDDIGANVLSLQPQN